MSFNWRYSKNGNRYTFNDEEPTKLTEPSKTWSFLAMDDIIASNVCKRFEWGFKFTTDTGYFSFMLGVVTHPREESIRKWEWRHFGEDEETKFRQFGIYIDSGSKGLYRYGVTKPNHYKIPCSGWKCWSNGDTFLYIVDFEAKEIRLIYNDEDLGVIFGNIPDIMHF